MNILIGDTDKGLVRKTNQDCFTIARLSDTLSFAVLCDGMGGENGGNVAAEMAVRQVRKALERGLAENMEETSLRSLLISAVSAANAVVYDEACKNPELSGMGTTIIAAVFSQRQVYFACVGDSRAYCVNGQGEQQLTHDHTVVQMLLDIGEITEEDAANHPKRHFITRAVGVAREIDVDFIVHDLGKDDILLLCSDGLYSYMKPGDFYPMLMSCVQQNSVQPLIDLALSCGGADNITAIVAADGQ